MEICWWEKNGIVFSSSIEMLNTKRKGWRFMWSYLPLIHSYFIKEVAQKTLALPLISKLSKRLLQRGGKNLTNMYSFLNRSLRAENIWKHLIHHSKFLKNLIKYSLSYFQPPWYENFRFKILSIILYSRVFHHISGI